MTIHNMYIFDRYGTLLYYGEWNRTKQSGMSMEECPLHRSVRLSPFINLKENVKMFLYPPPNLYDKTHRCSVQTKRKNKQEGKLMYGMLFSIKSFVAKISPLDPKEGFLHYKTSKYTLHCLETPSGLKFVMSTDNQAQGVRDLLKKIYAEVYVKYAIRNPLCASGEPIISDLFKNKLDTFIKQAPIHTVRAS